MRIVNPILPGFHPDPSILRVGEDYYIATSTFEWCPSVFVHHSRDLVNWRPLGGLLPLPLSGVPDSGGVWAPDLTHANGLFHLVYSVVDNYAHGYKDLRNYLTTAPSIDGPWSEPVPLHGRGFDAALFHQDGATWMLNMVFDSRIGRGFAGIEIQPLSGGEPVRIFEGPVAEGPHIYRVGDWYYLVVAEGGTGYQHGVTVARSASLFGPYERDPAGPMLTARHDPDLALQKAGHGCLVEVGDGEWYLAHLAARPYGPRGRCVLGRETALQRVEWVESWPRVADGRRRPPPEAEASGASQPAGPRVAGGVPAVEVLAPDLPPHPWPASSGPQWLTLRRPAAPDWLTVSSGGFRIHGGQSPYGLRSPSLVGRPVTDRRCSLTATVEFQADGVHQAAGVTAYYNTRNWYFLAITADGLVLTGSDRGVRREIWHRAGAVRRAELRVEFDGPLLRFAVDGTVLPVEVDATILSDENADEIVDGQVRVFGFTGAFVGLWVQDLANEGAVADFSSVAYLAG